MISNIVFLFLHHLEFENYTEGTSSEKIKNKIIFKRDNKNVKKSRHLKNLFFSFFFFFGFMHHKRSKLALCNMKENTQT